MRVHVAILTKAYLYKILIGEKTIESRFSRVKCLPHGEVAAGDKVFLKEVSGPIVAVVDVSDAMTFEDLTIEQTRRLLDRFHDGLSLESDFIQHALSARYATLVFLKDVKRIDPVRIDKRDRRPWVILPAQQGLMGEETWEERLWLILDNC